MMASVDTPRLYRMPIDREVCPGSRHSPHSLEDGVIVIRRVCVKESSRSQLFHPVLLTHYQQTNTYSVRSLKHLLSGVAMLANREIYRALFIAGSFEVVDEFIGMEDLVVPVAAWMQFQSSGAGRMPQACSDHHQTFLDD